jgi:hypothetical protein
MNPIKFYKYSMLLFLLGILFTPMGSNLWQPFLFVGLISGVLWIKSMVV